VDARAFESLGSTGLERLPDVRLGLWIATSASCSRARRLGKAVVRSAFHRGALRFSVGAQGYQSSFSGFQPTCGFRRTRKWMLAPRLGSRPALHLGNAFSSCRRRHLRMSGRFAAMGESGGLLKRIRNLVSPSANCQCRQHGRSAKVSRAARGARIGLWLRSRATAWMVAASRSSLRTGRNSTFDVWRSCRCHRAPGCVLSRSLYRAPRGGFPMMKAFHASRVRKPLGPSSGISTHPGRNALRDLQTADL